MNKKIVEKLWLVANKVRGIFGISELCKIMVYTLFLKHIELKNNQDENDGMLAVYDEKFSLGYLSLTYGRMVNAYDIAKYLAEVEKEFGLEGNVIADEFKRLLEKVDSESVKMIFDEIEEIKFNDTEQLYNVTLLLLNKLICSSGRNGEYFTNSSLCRLETALLDCREGMNVYDGFCGSGVSINEVAGNKGTVYLQDINVSTLAIASVITILKGNKIGAIGCGDSQLNPLLDEKYDRIVSEPPFSMKYSKEYFASIPQGNYIYQENTDSESLALRHSLAHLKEDGVAVILMPMGFLFKSGKGSEVRELLCRDYIDAVIELPAGVFYPYSRVLTALLVLKKRKSDNSIFLINAKDFFEKELKNQAIISEENVSKIVELYHNRETVEGVSRNTPVEDIAENGFNLCTAQYVTLCPMDTITVEDTMVYVQKYDKLISSLSEIDKQLETVRSRFTKS